MKEVEEVISGNIEAEEDGCNDDRQDNSSGDNSIDFQNEDKSGEQSYETKEVEEVISGNIEAEEDGCNDDRQDNSSGDNSIDFQNEDKSGGSSNSGGSEE